MQAHLCLFLYVVIEPKGNVLPRLRSGSALFFAEQDVAGMGVQLHLQIGNACGGGGFVYCGYTLAEIPYGVVLAG